MAGPVIFECQKLRRGSEEVPRAAALTCFVMIEDAPDDGCLGWYKFKGLELGALKDPSGLRANRYLRCYWIIIYSLRKYYAVKITAKFEIVLGQKFGLIIFLYFCNMNLKYYSCTFEI